MKSSIAILRFTVVVFSMNVHCFTVLRESKGYLKVKNECQSRIKRSIYIKGSETENTAIEKLFISIFFSSRYLFFSSSGRRCLQVVSCDEEQEVKVQA